jgi:hypothetical protein
MAMGAYIILPIFCEISNVRLGNSMFYKLLVVKNPQLFLSYGQMFLDLRNSGLALTDIVGIEAALILNGLIQPFFMIIFSFKSHLLTDICCRLLEINKVLNVTEVQIQLAFRQQKLVLSGLFLLGYISRIKF